MDVFGPGSYVAMSANTQSHVDPYGTEDDPYENPLVGVDAVTARPAVPKRNYGLPLWRIILPSTPSRIPGEVIDGAKAGSSLLYSFGNILGDNVLDTPGDACEAQVALLTSFHPHPLSKKLITHFLTQLGLQYRLSEREMKMMQIRPNIRRKPSARGGLQQFTPALEGLVAAGGGEKRIDVKVHHVSKTAATLGSFHARFSGKLTVTPYGNSEYWFSFDGSVKYEDDFDFNSATHRRLLIELLVRGFNLVTSRTSTPFHITSEAVSFSQQGSVSGNAEQDRVQSELVFDTHYKFDSHPRIPAE